MYFFHIEPLFLAMLPLKKRYFRPCHNKEIESLDHTYPRKSQRSLLASLNKSLDCAFLPPSLSSSLTFRSTHSEDLGNCFSGLVCCDRMSGSSGIVISGYRHSLWTVATINFICVCVCLSRFYGLYLGYYGSDFDQSW